VEHFKTASDFARLCGVSALQSQAGFIPENPNDPVFKDVVTAARRNQP
jgi:hypothetical protein